MTVQIPHLGFHGGIRLTQSVSAYQVHSDGESPTRYRQRYIIHWRLGYYILSDRLERMTEFVNPLLRVSSEFREVDLGIEIYRRPNAQSHRAHSRP